MFASRRPLRATDIAIRAGIVVLALSTAYIHSTLGGLLFTLNALGYVTAEARPGCLFLTSFHTFPTENTVVKTQSLIEQR